MFEETKAAFGKLDILVNNAGIMDGMEPVGEISDEKWDRTICSKHNRCNACNAYRN